MITPEFFTFLSEYSNFNTVYGKITGLAYAMRSFSDKRVDTVNDIVHSLPSLDTSKATFRKLNKLEYISENK